MEEFLSLANRCESCGMPMATNEEHGAQDPNSLYCIHCTDLNGKLMSFEKKFEDLVNLAMKMRWLNREEGERAVRSEMAQMPAWKDKVPQAAKPS